MRSLLALLLITACAAQQPQREPAATTPPPPLRPENAAVATGIVTDGSGRPVPFARVAAWAADPACRTIGRPVVHVSGADGRYELRVPSSVGPEFEACIVAEAAANGSTVRVQQPVHYASDAAGRNAARIDLVLPQPPLLTRAEADRLIALLGAAMRGEQDAVEELKLYVPDLSMLSSLARYTRGIDSVRMVSEGDRRFVYELKGRRPERNVQVTVAQDTLTRIELPVLTSEP